jgi:hypothetical protein
MTTIASGISAAGRFDLVADGRIRPDDGSERLIPLRLSIPGTVCQAGRGPAELALRLVDLDLVAVDLGWINITKKGWIHLRGEASGSDGGRYPMRADIFSAETVDAVGSVDRIGLRVYAQGADPDLASPIHKITGSFESGGVSVIEG